ncbi:MAG: hypothetical protein ACK4OP_00130 [Gemmobacter sp.]
MPDLFQIWTIPASAVNMVTGEVDLTAIVPEAAPVLAPGIATRGISVRISGETYLTQIGAPEVVTPATFTGTLTEGETLTGAVGTYTGQPTLALRWLRDGDPISGATGTTYTQTAADVGAVINFRVTATNAGGSVTSTTTNTAATASGSVAPGSAVNIEAPAILGALPQGSDLTFDLGIWTGPVDRFEIAVERVDPPEVVLARQAVTLDTEAQLVTVVGAAYLLRVWAIDAGNATIGSAVSAPFGPIAAPADIWVRGVVLSASTSHDPTPLGSPVTWTLSAPDALANPYAVPPGWGWIGGVAMSFSTRTGAGDPRLVGRWGANIAPGGKGLVIHLPDGPGTYIVHSGSGGNQNLACNYAIRDGDVPSAPLLAEITGNTTSSTTMDAMGNVTTHAAWTAASPYGGVGREVVATGNALWFGRTSGGGTPHLNCVAVLKKVN